MKRIILTALDNNNTIWYEQFLPFILSLQKTDFYTEKKGDIGVLDYGLSLEKKAVLEKNNIFCFPPSHCYSEMLLDRHISVADIAEKYAYEQIAFYDADIWFPSQTLTIFDQIIHEDNLYCAYDAWRCSFLTDVISEDRIDEFNKKIDVLEKKNGYVWQVGVVLGSKKAFLNYKEYVQYQLNKNSYFNMRYGIDTSLVNLYSYDENKVSVLPTKYNCTPVWGIKHLVKNHQHFFLIENEQVEGFHITRNHREDKLITFNGLYPDDFYNRGKAFQTKNYILYNIIRESLVTNNSESQTKLSLNYAKANGHLLIKFDSGDLFRKNALCIECSGESTISFINNQDSPVILYWLYSGIATYPECTRIYVNNGAIFTPKQNHYYKDIIGAGKTISFNTQDLNVEEHRIQWFFASLQIV